MDQALAQRVRAMQDSMVEAARLCFLESELDDLRVVVRLTVEFHNYLLGVDPAPGVEDKVRYVCESVFSGVDSFDLLSWGYMALPGAQSTTVGSSVASIESLKDEFLSRYRSLSAETNFETRCRLLLDLFKLQIVLPAYRFDRVDWPHSPRPAVWEAARRLTGTPFPTAARETRRSIARISLRPGGFA